MKVTVFETKELARDEAFSQFCTLQDICKTAVLARLASFEGNRTHAARSLGISVRTLQRKILRYNQAQLQESK